MKTLTPIKRVAILMMAALTELATVAQKPYEFRCTDYLATPDRSQEKLSYDTETNTFTITDEGAFNIAFQMDKGCDLAYYITNEQTWFVVEGSNLSTALSGSAIWWFNGYNQGTSASADCAVRTEEGTCIVAWNIKDNDLLNAHMNYADKEIYLTSGGSEFSHCLGLTSTTGKSTISHVGYFAPYELAATYPALMKQMGYTADGTSLTTELRTKVEAFVAEANQMVADEAYATQKTELEEAVSKAGKALGTMGETDYTEALRILKDLRQEMDRVKAEAKRGISTYYNIENGIEARQGELYVKAIFHAPNVVRIYKSYSADLTRKKSLSVVQTPATQVDFTVEEKDGMVTMDNGRVRVSMALETGYIVVSRTDGTVFTQEGECNFVPYMDGPNESYRIRQTFHLDKEEYIFGMGQIQNGSLNQRGKMATLVQNNMKKCKNRKNNQITQIL